MSQSTAERLDSWKEIASYLGRDLRTVRRWEKDKGLPVHRVPGGARRSVFAFRSEMDAWLLKTDAASSAGLIPENAAPECCEADEVRTEGAAAAAQIVPHPGWWWKPIYTVHRANLAVVLLVVLTMVAFGVVLKSRLPDQPLDKLTFSGNSIQARSPKGDLIWTYSFHQPLTEENTHDTYRIQVANLAGGNGKVALVAVPFSAAFQDNSRSDALFAFSSTGERLWRYDVHEALRFDGKEYGTPWFISALLVTQEGTHSNIWCAADSLLWSPSSLAKLDEHGRLRAMFVNWGHIHVLSHIQSKEGSFLFVGGINNQCNCAMLAVLRVDQPSGSSPNIPGVESSCDTCPVGSPYRYFIFPRSELAQATDTTYSQVGVVLPGEAGIRIAVKETNGGPGPLGPDWKMYDLSPDFELRGFTVSDHIRELHTQLEAAGKIKHRVEQCPELHRPQPVRVWSAQDGWKTVQVRPM